MMKTLLGLPVCVAVQRLEAQGIRYTMIKTEEPKKTLHGTDERVVRVKKINDSVELVVSGFRTEQEEISC